MTWAKWVNVHSFDVALLDREVAPEYTITAPAEQQCSLFLVYYSLGTSLLYFRHPRTAPVANNKRKKNWRSPQEHSLGLFLGIWNDSIPWCHVRYHHCGLKLIWTEKHMPHKISLTCIVNESTPGCTPLGNYKNKMGSGAACDSGRDLIRPVTKAVTWDPLSHLIYELCVLVTLWQHDSFGQ